MSTESQSCITVQPAHVFVFLLPNILLVMILCFNITHEDIKQCQAQHLA